METSSEQEVAAQLELIRRHQAQIGQRIHSHWIGYIALGTLWAAPIATLPAGYGWAGFAALATAAVTLLWGWALTRRTGVRLAPVPQDSRAAVRAAWLLCGWGLCAVTALVATGLGAPVVAFVAAIASAAVTAWMGVRIDRELVTGAVSAEVTA